MNGTLYLRPEARDELREAFGYYEERRAGLGFEFLRAVRLSLASIERGPEQFPIAVDDMRMVPLRRFPYVVYFVILGSGVSVLAVIHGRRHPMRWRSRR